MLRQDEWLSGQADAQGRRDIAWFSVWGLPMTQEEWDDPVVRCVAALLDGSFAGGASVLLLFNASGESVTFTLPDGTLAPGEWSVRVDTAQGCFDADAGPRVAAGGQLELPAHAMALLTQPAQERDDAVPT